jgi:hypothetical protein
MPVNLIFDARRLAMVETSNGDGRNYEGALRKWTCHEENMEYLKNMIDKHYQDNPRQRRNHEENMEYLKNMIDKYYQDSPGKRRSHEETMEYIKNMIGRQENHERNQQN